MRRPSGYRNAPSGGAEKRQRVDDRDKQDSKSGEWQDAPRGNVWELVENGTNALYETYYQEQQIVPEGEWDSFMRALRTPLPTSFRVSPTSQYKDATIAVLESEYRPLISKCVLEGCPNPDLQCLDWYPGHLAYQSSVPKMSLRKTPELATFQKFLVAQTARGTITRQEVVSMIPPLFLDVQPQHRVLDMCAAPGSKTSQILEFLHSHHKSTPDGCVVANDMDAGRAKMLIHQLKRLQTPCVAIINTDARRIGAYPLGHGSDVHREERVLRYDRILADVPCSGDGTLRKSPDIWSSWTPGNGISLHAMQLQILCNGMSLCAPGARLVYSTCSLNPIEDEAVIAEALRRNQSFELVDCSGHLPGLLRCPGLSTWRVYEKGSKSDKELRHVPTYDGMDAAQKHVVGLKPTMWPPSVEEAAKMHLERCMRVLPHQQDTGGFFIAVLAKRLQVVAPTVVKASEAALPEGAVAGDAVASAADAVSRSDAAPVAAPTPAEAAAAARAAVQNPHKNVRARRDDELRSFAEDPKLMLFLKEVQDFYGISPEVAAKHLLASSAGCRRMYWVNERLHALVDCDRTPRPIIFSAGIKAFERNHNQQQPGCKFRIRQEAVNYLLPHMTKRVVAMSAADFRALISLTAKGASKDKLFPENFSACVSEVFTALSTGCFIASLDDAGAAEVGAMLACVAWRAPHGERRIVSVARGVCFELRVQPCLR
jgi:tRNA (cytosine34-C5)-methyltransferase